ncbi:MAG: class I SAM-dependent methyltransferase [Rhizobiaceae bacterium]|nr:class I SAM-dependent methyltransferase [Rhizobiaceae bacterium]
MGIEKNGAAICSVCKAVASNSNLKIRSKRQSWMISCTECDHVFDENQNVSAEYNSNTQQKSVMEKYTVAKLHLKLDDDGSIKNGSQYGEVFGKRLGSFKDYIEGFSSGAFVSQERKPRMLDIGLGASGSLRYFADLGFDVYGIDTDPVALEFQKELCPEAHLKEGFFPDVHFEEKVDVVVAFHVLEHIPDPPKFMKVIRRICAEPAMLLFEVPNLINTRNAEQDFRTWNMWGASGVHLQHYSPRSMAISLALGGWSILNYHQPLDLEREVMTGAAISGHQDSTKRSAWSLVMQQ